MNLIQKIYNPFELAKIKGPSAFSVDLLQFSLGRQALYQTVHFLNQFYGKSIIVAVPKFICRDVSDAIIAAGGSIEWYEIKREDLRIAKKSEVFTTCDAVLSVNYFGMASRVTEFSDKIIIEDNAHGLFSKSRDRKWLGTRGDFGIFSLRKTLPVSSGAGLFLSEKWKASFKRDTEPEFIETWINKSFLRKIATILPPSCFHKILKLKRNLAKSKDPMVLSDYTPKVVNYPEHLICNLAVDEEIQRRLDLYELCRTFMTSFQNFIEVFEFDENETPYCFPFYLKDKKLVGKIEKFLNRKGLDLVKWPDLPDTVLHSEEEWYHNVYFIPFLW